MESISFPRPAMLKNDYNDYECECIVIGLGGSYRERGGDNHYATMVVELPDGRLSQARAIDLRFTDRS